ncbi:MAG: PAS domain S-box protein [Rubrivivax sp.]|nr:MAG: PAS domain S-box protein [Rubrivivax sp.]
MSADGFSHAAPWPADEKARLATLARQDIMDTPPEREFDDIVHVAAALCQAPIALVSLVDADRQWFKSRLGLDATETPRGLAFCGYAILGDGLFEVPNALDDERFRDNPLVTGHPDIRFYAGAPLTMPDGQRLGTLCVIDRAPREMSQQQRDALMRLGRQVTRQIELRHSARLAQGREAVQREMVLVHEALAADAQAAGAFDGVLAELLRLVRSPAGRLTDLPSNGADPGRLLVLAEQGAADVPSGSWLDLALHAAGETVGRLTLAMADAAQADDITERVGPLLAPLAQLVLARRVTLARTVAEQRLRGIASQIPGMVYQYRLYPDGRQTIPYASDGIRDVFGAEPTDVEIPAQPVFMRLHLDDIPAVSASIERSMTELQPWHQEYRVMHPTRGELWVEGRATPQRLADGSILWHGFATDVSERKRLELDRLAQGEMLARLLESLVEGVVACGAHGELSFFNDTARRWHGIDVRAVPPEQWGEHYNLFEPDGSTPLVMSRIPLMRALTGERLDEVEICIKAKDQPPRFVRCNGGPLNAPDGRLLGAVAVMHDVTGRRDAERALAAERMRMANVIEAADLGTGEWRFDTGEVVFNERWAAQLGHRLEELQPTTLKTWMDRLHPDDVEGATTLLKQHLRGDTRYYEVVLRLKHRDGHWVWIQHRGKVIEFNADGRPLRMYGIFADVTQAHQQREAVRQSEARFRDMVATLPGVVYRCRNDADWSMMYMSSGVEALTGYPPHELVDTRTRSFASLIHPDDLPATYAVAEALANQLPFELTYRIRHAQGHWLWVREKGRGAYDHAGQLLYLGGFIWDVTDRLVAERALADSAQYQRALIDNVVDGIVTVDEEGRIESFNRAAQQIFGHAEAEVIGQPMSRLIPPQGDDPEGQVQDLARQWSALDEEALGARRELEARRASGEGFPIELAVSAVYREGVRKYVGVIRDITELKRTERMKNEFVSMVSHELRTPLTSIAGSLGLITGGALGPVPPLLDNMLRIASQNSKRLSQLINDLLDMDKLIAGKMSFHLAEHALPELLHESAQAMQGYAEQHQVRVEVLVDAGAAVAVVQVDPLRLQQVLSNYLSNAIKFSPAARTVELRLATRQGRAVVSVKDEGPGIPDEFRAQLFTKFSQADSSDRRQKGGTGLGLAITKELVERMGGTVGFESTPGSGATFWFELPLVGSAASGGVAGSAEPEAEAEVPRLLVVEDDAATAAWLSTLLCQAGYGVTVAHDLAQARTALAGQSFSAITLDLSLPDGNGVELIQEVRADPETAGLPILVVSSHSERGCLAFSGSLAALEWLGKPLDDARVLGSLRHLVSRNPDRRARVLHVEDDVDLRQVIARALAPLADVDGAGSIEAARALFTRREYDLVLLDLSLPDGDGWQLFRQWQLSHPDLPVVVLSATELTPAQFSQARAVLAKSRASPEQFLATLENLLPRPAPRMESPA